MTENIVTGKKYRILTDAVNDAWDRISFWTKASDVYYDDNTTAEANKPINIMKRSTSYTVGTVAYELTAPSWVMLKCTTAGTTASTTPSTYSTITTVGTVITDGTAKFTVYDARPSSTLSTSAFQIPSMSLVNSLDSELTANGNKFYFDYQDGKYGYNTSASRESTTFVPFGGSKWGVEVIKGYQQREWFKFTSDYLDSGTSTYQYLSIGNAKTVSLPNSTYFTQVKTYEGTVRASFDVTIRKAGTFLVNSSSVRTASAGSVISCGSNHVGSGIIIMYELDS